MAIPVALVLNSEHGNNPMLSSDHNLYMFTMERGCFLFILLLHQIRIVRGFIGQNAKILPITTCPPKWSDRTNKNNRCLTIVNDQRWNREIEENSRKKAQGGGMGETVAGAVLGSLVLGPFGRYLLCYRNRSCSRLPVCFHNQLAYFHFAFAGAIFGASIGANLGARKAEMEARKAEIERLGLSQDMLDMAQDIGLSLEKSIEGMEAVRSSLETQQKLAKLLDADSSSLYTKARHALDESNEELARKLLLERTSVQEKLKKVLVSCTEERGRLQKMEENIAQLERRALEIDSLLRRTVSAKSLQGTADLDVGLSLRSEDPLLQKFKDLGID